MSWRAVVFRAVALICLAWQNPSVFAVQPQSFFAQPRSIASAATLRLARSDQPLRRRAERYIIMLQENDGERDMHEWTSVFCVAIMAIGSLNASNAPPESFGV